MRFAAMLAGFVLVAPLPAHATGEIESLITQADRDRLARFDTVKQGALADARKDGSPDAVERIDEIMARQTLSFADFDLTGNWRCRTIKLGGPSSLVVYDWFRCRVTDDGSGWKLEKLSGSQRTTGRFFTESDTALTYLGAFYVAGDDAPAYGATDDSDQVGRTFRDGETSWRIEFPLPRYESKFDILELRR